MELGQSAETTCGIAPFSWTRLSVCLSVCVLLHVTNRAALVYFMKYHSGKYLLQFINTFQFLLKSSNSNVRLRLYTRTCIFAYLQYLENKSVYIYTEVKNVFNQFLQAETEFMFRGQYTFP